MILHDTLASKLMSLELLFFVPGSLNDDVLAPSSATSSGT